MFCPKCGTQLEDGSVFCGSCGTKIEQEAASAEASPAAGKPLAAFKLGNMNFQIVKEKIDLIGLVAAVVAFISLFLPYYTCSVEAWGLKEKESCNFFTGTTGISIFLLLAILAYIACNLFALKRQKQICGYVALACVVFTAIDLVQNIAEVKAAFSFYSSAIKVYPSIGFWIMLIAALVMGLSWLIESKVLPLVKKN